MPTKFQADSIFTIEKKDLGEKITELFPDIMTDIMTALQIELDLKTIKLIYLLLCHSYLHPLFLSKEDKLYISSPLTGGD